MYVAGGHQKIEGESNFIFNPKFSHKPLIGSNVVRIGDFEMDFDLVDPPEKFEVNKAVKCLNR